MEAIDTVFNDVKLFEKLDLGLARENGAEIYLCREPKEEFYDLYHDVRQNLIDEFYRKRKNDR